MSVRSTGAARRAPATRVARSSRSLSAALRRRFEAVVFDWDGTAVADRQADAGQVREAVEAACALGIDVVVSGTHVDNVDGQLRARPQGPGLLYFSLNRGSEVFVRMRGRFQRSYEPGFSKH